MDLQTIAKKTGLPIRLIRYVLDHEVLPGGPVRQIREAKGQPRTLTDLEAFAVAIAATLLQAGLRREAVSKYLAQLVAMKCSFVRGISDEVLLGIMTSKYPAIARFAGDESVRVVHHGKETGWRPSALRNEPQVIVEMDLASVRRELFGQ